MIYGLGLGRNQKRIIARMMLEKLVIRYTFDERDSSHELWLEDEEGNNSYEKLSPRLMDSLLRKDLFTCEHFRPCLQILIDTYRIKPDSS